MYVCMTLPDHATIAVYRKQQLNISMYVNVERPTSWNELRASEVFRGLVAVGGARLNLCYSDKH